jgi:hypothetical protein
VFSTSPRKKNKKSQTVETEPGQHVAHTNPTECFPTVSTYIRKRVVVARTRTKPNPMSTRIYTFFIRQTLRSVDCSLLHISRPISPMQFRPTVTSTARNPLFPFQIHFLPLDSACLLSAPAAEGGHNDRSICTPERERERDGNKRGLHCPRTRECLDHYLVRPRSAH